MALDTYSCGVVTFSAFALYHAYGFALYSATTHTDVSQAVHVALLVLASLMTSYFDRKYSKSVGGNMQ